MRGCVSGRMICETWPRFVYPAREKEHRLEDDVPIGRPFALACELTSDGVQGIEGRHSICISSVSLRRSHCPRVCDIKSKEGGFES